jgi:uncharacterized membrane protein (Fun14 family)
MNGFVIGLGGGILSGAVWGYAKKEVSMTALIIIALAVLVLYLSATGKLQRFISGAFS